MNASEVIDGIQEVLPEFSENWKRTNTEHSEKGEYFPDYLWELTDFFIDEFPETERRKKVYLILEKGLENNEADIANLIFTMFFESLVNYYLNNDMQAKLQLLIDEVGGKARVSILNWIR